MPSVKRAGGFVFPSVMARRDREMDPLPGSQISVCLLPEIHVTSLLSCGVIIFILVQSCQSASYTSLHPAFRILLPFARESLLSDGAGNGDFLVLAGRRENGEKTADDHIVDAAFIAGERFQLDILLCRNNSMVVGYFCVVDKRFVRPDLLHGKAGGSFPVGPGRACLQAFF